MAFVDLDRLKHINDTFGHQEGNRALVEATHVLKDSLRQCDILARPGGDEFAALLVDAGEETIDVVWDRIHCKLDTSNANAGRRYDLPFSVGIVAADARQVADIEKLLSQADTLMYEQRQHTKASS